MIQQLQDIYNDYVNKLNTFKGSKTTMGGGLEYKGLWAKTFAEFAGKLDDAAVHLEKTKQFERKEIKIEVARLIDLFKKNF